MSDRFGAGDLCLLTDAKGRHYLIELKAGSSFQYHSGSILHDDLIGEAPGTSIRSSTGSRLVAGTPRLADYILKMPRGAQVVYPKDIGAIVHWADIRPGDTAVEAGTGSGALTLALLRAVGPSGRVLSFETRQEHLEHARRTIERFSGGMPANLQLIQKRVEDGLAATAPDRVVLDLPEPWAVAEPAAAVFKPGGILCSYLPTVPQVQRLHDALRLTKRYAAPETFEILIRDWRIEGRSVRPSSRMVGHTGFITVASHVSEPGED